MGSPSPDSGLGQEEGENKSEESKKKMKEEEEAGEDQKCEADIGKTISQMPYLSPP